jgi:hypothetical protein
MPLVGLEPTISVFKQAKTVHTLDRTATVIGYFTFTSPILNKKCKVAPKLKNHTMQTYGGMEVRLNTFLTSAL